MFTIAQQTSLGYKISYAHNKEEPIKRKERTRILVHCSNESLTQWMQYFGQQMQFHVTKEPKSAPTVLRMRENAQHSLFYLGKALVSGAGVKCRDTVGIGLVQGNKLKKSCALTAIDAARSAPLDGVSQLEKALTREKQEQDAAYARHMADILKTHVNFETMDV